MSALRRARCWWAARREFRRALCRWCRDPILGVPARTLTGRRVHRACREPADEFDYEGTIW